MQVLRLLAARRALPTTMTARPTAASEPPDSELDAEEEDYDEGPFFDLDLDFSAASVRASSSSSSAGSASESDSDLDLVISLHRSRSASPSYDALLHAPPMPVRPFLKPCRASEPGAGLRLRALSFGAARHSSARSSGSARSLRLFMESPAPGGENNDDADAEEPQPQPEPRDVFRRYLTKISRRLRRGVSVARPRAAAGEAGSRGLRRLRKSRSASAAVTVATTTSRRDDSLAEKQDGIASAIAHCKESLHRASLSSDDCASPLLRSRSDPGPGKCQPPSVPSPVRSS